MREIRHSGYQGEVLRACVARHGGGIWSYWRRLIVGRMCLFSDGFVIFVLCSLWSVVVPVITVVITGTSCPDHCRADHLSFRCSNS